MIDQPSSSEKKTRIVRVVLLILSLIQQLIQGLSKDDPELEKLFSAELTKIRQELGNGAGVM